MKKIYTVQNVKGMLHTVDLVDEMVTLYQNAVGIHTFELRWCVGKNEEGQQTLQRIWDVIKQGKVQGKRLRLLMNGLWAEILPLYRGSYSDLTVLKMIVNPRVMVDKEEGYLGISERYTLSACFILLEEFWAKHGIGIQINDCWLTRADVCMNLQLDSKFHIPGYIDLLNRTPHDLRYSLKTDCGMTPNLHSAGFSNASRCLCIYDKAYEQRRFSVDKAEQCPNLLRIELRLYSSGLKRVLKNHPSMEVKENLCYIADFAPQILSEGVCMCLPGEPYIKLEKILAVIDKHTELHEKSRQYMRALAKHLEKENTYDALLERSTRSLLRELNRKYYGIGISPACIRGENQPDFLPSLSSMVIKVLRDAGKLF